MRKWSFGVSPRRPSFSPQPLPISPRRCVTFMIAVVCSQALWAEEPNAQPFISVEADYFEVDMAAERAYFTGNVAATQGNNTFRTSQLTLHLDQVIAGSGSQQSATQGTPPNQALYQLSAAELTYDLSGNLISGSGDSELRRGRELIRADRISYRVDTQMAYGRSNPEGRVTVQFLANPETRLFPSAPLSLANGADPAGE